MTEADSSPTPRRRPRWQYVLAIVFGALLVLVVVASQIQLNYYALSPGQAQAVGPLVRVPPGKAHLGRGEILLTDVLLSRVSLLAVVPSWLSGDTLESSADVLGPYTPPDQLVDQGYVEMAQSQAAAKAAALRRLGYAVPEHDAGALIFSVEPGSPAAGVLSVGQIVTAVGAIPTANACAFVGALRTYSPGQVATLTVETSRISSTGVVESGRQVTTSVRLARPPAHAPASGCPGVSGPPTVSLGVEAETQQDFTYPFPVSVDTADIGGPSAGLAMTLGIIEKLTPASVTGGATIAATGTIDANGDVGDVGGVAQKTVSVARAGASAFLVPPQELQVARAHASAGLRVFAVSSLDQALDVLGRLGGHVPASTVPATG